MKRAFFLCFFFLYLNTISLTPEKASPNFILVTIDTWRADYISASGSKKVKTPFLDKLAEEGIYLKYVDTPCPMTTPAHASILTGLYPKNHGIRDNRNFKLKDVVTLPELFKLKGYNTFAVVSGAPLSKKYGLNKGFDFYDDDDLEDKNNLQKILKGSLKSAHQVTEKALELIDKSQGNIFLWVHFYDPHYPYNPPAKFKEIYPEDYYAGEVAYVDAVLKAFLENLFKKNKERWIVIVAGDHGEDLGENGEDTHGILLYNTTRKVPFIYWDSEKKYKQFGTGAKNLIDIFPTLQELFELKKTNCDGISVFENTNRYMFAETFFPLCFAANPGFSAKKENLVYIKNGTSAEIYEDTFKEKGLNPSSEKIFYNEAQKEIDKYFNEREDFTPTLKLTSEELKILSSLGYIGSSSNLEKITKCDLREMARDFSEYTKKGWEVLHNGDLNIILQEYNKLLKKYPYSPLLHCDKSDLLVKMMRYDEAYEECKVCTAMDPTNSSGYFRLANLSAMKGKFKEAENYYLYSIKYDEKLSIAHLNLGMIYFEKLNNPAAALKHLKRFLELDPKHPKAKMAKDVIKDLESDSTIKK